MATIAQTDMHTHYSRVAETHAPDDAARGFPMLVEAALERIALARRKMTDGREGESGNLLQSAGKLVAQLRGDLALSAGDSYAANLDDVCDYVSRQLVTASGQARVAKLDEMSHLLREIRTAWVVYV
jgi:flagellar secretion chaperone FliS